VRGVGCGVYLGGLEYVVWGFTVQGLGFRGKD